ncbi:MAG TPA: ectonucleotide pyrophosphatase/phosphodiesterase [Opitutaceae bacterium]|nr:ectonucleotide pyrophosphatase/phosphodiesterase [Opitutaceae bacterium]
MKTLRRLGAFLVVVCWIQLACAQSHPLLVVSLDAFRWDYCDLHPKETPNLRRLKKEGASAKSLISVYPSNTFPNHYSIATGLRPEHHGMINNTFFDPQIGAYFRYTSRECVGDSRWWGGEPIWITAVKQGRRSACSFWVGSETAIDGLRPTYWMHYDYSIPFAQRLEQLVGWLTLPEGERPDLVMFYLEETNSVAHTFGPESPETVKAIQLLDTRIGAMIEALDRAGVNPNLVVVSDHGMTDVKPERCVALDDIIDLSTVQVDFTGPQAGLRPLKGSVEELLAKLQHLPAGAVAYRREDLPKALHVGDNPRFPPVWVVPQEGGSISTKQALAAWLAKTKGEHGYDPEIRSMQGTLIVHGPDLASDGRAIDSVENIDLYNLFCALLRLKPAPNDGDDRAVRELVK